jgi:hypothetical protein
MRRREREFLEEDDEALWLTSEFRNLHEQLQDVKDLLRELKLFATDLHVSHAYDLMLLQAKLTEELLTSVDYPTFDFTAIDDHFFRFRFAPARLYAMAEQLLPRFVIHRRCKASGLMALCIVLRRLSYPCRWADLRMEFGGASRSWLSSIFVATMEHLYKFAKAELQSWSSNLFSDICNLTSFAEDLLGLFAWAAIDGTGMHICRAHLGQRAFYSGYEKYHLIRSLAIHSFNGMFERIFGPTVGSASDTSLFSDFGVEAELEALHEQFFQIHGYRPLILGDSIFSNTVNVVTPFKQPKKLKKINGVRPPRPVQDKRLKHFNLFHSRTRIGGEWGFQRLLANFASLDFSKAQKIYFTSPDKAFLVGALFTNFIVADRGSQHECYYGTCAPEFGEYLRKVANILPRNNV